MSYTRRTYNTIDYRYAWTADWYTWDAAAARKDAMAERAADAKQLRAEGYTVRMNSQKCLMSRGGIGSDHPHIELWATAFYLVATKDTAVNA